MNKDEFFKELGEKFSETIKCVEELPQGIGQTSALLKIQEAIWWSEKAIVDYDIKNPKKGNDNHYNYFCFG